VRVENEAAFTLAALQAVIAEVKNELKTAQERLSAAERRADQDARKFEFIAREVDEGLMVFDREGFITVSNAHVSNLLAVDTRSRRRYSEILESIPRLVEMIGASLEAAVEIRREKVEYQNWEGSKRAMEVSVFPIRDKRGETEAVACLFREASS
jgi:PAS domain-containing protein